MVSPDKAFSAGPCRFLRAPKQGFGKPEKPVTFPA